MTTKKLLPADLIFTRSDSLLGSAIRWFERSSGEPESWTNHTAGIGLSNNVVEAQSRVISIPFDGWSVDKTFQVWRTNDLDEGQRSRVAAYAEAHIGREYGYLKLVPHALDGLLSKMIGGSPYVFRRVLFQKKYPICSWVWAFAYGLVGLDFGMDPRECSPDDQLDFCLEHPEKWERII